MKPAIDSLQTVLDEIAVPQRDFYKALGSAGMLCCRSTNTAHRCYTKTYLKVGGVTGYFTTRSK